MTKFSSMAANPKGSRCPIELETSFQISFDDGELDAGEVMDEKDPEYIPSDWDISMNVAPPEGLVVEMHLEADVHDIGFDEEDSDITSKDTTRKKDSDVASKGTICLCHVTPSDQKEPMVMVSASSLQRLTDLVPYTICTKCKEKTEVKRHTAGCGWKFRWECKNAHSNYTWSSQPVLPNGVMLGNFKMAASIILSGNNYAKVALLFKFLRVGLLSQTAFNQIQSNFVVPVVNTYWQNMKASAQEEHRSTRIVIAGDGRMDSPGHTANLCTYTMMNQDGKKILAMEVKDKREVQLKSGRMEAKGFERAMADILGAGVNVEVVTDAHADFLDNEFPVYRCRSYLAAIDYMYHIDRSFRKNKNGETYYSKTYSKAANHWTFKFVKVPKTYEYIPEIMLQIVNTYTAHHKEQPISRNVIQDPDDPRRMSSTIAPSSPPHTEAIVRKYQSRLEKWPRPSTSTE